MEGDKQNHSHTEHGNESGDASTELEFGSGLKKGLALAGIGVAAAHMIAPAVGIGYFLAAAPLIMKAFLKGATPGKLLSRAHFYVVFKHTVYPSVKTISR